MHRIIRRPSSQGRLDTASETSSLIDRVPDALFRLDHRWRFSYLNAGAERLFGRPRAEVRGRRLWDVFPETVGTIFDEQYRRAVDQSIPVAFEACHPPSGSRVEVRAFPTGDGLDVHARDVAPVKRAAEALRRWVQFDEVRFRSLVEHAADIIALLNLDGTVRYVSPALKRVLGYSPEEWIGRSAFEMIHPDDDWRMRRLFDEQSQSRGIMAITECRVRHLDGTWRHVEAVGNNLADEPSVSGVVFTARDISERKQMEAQLYASEASFEAVFDGAAIGIGVADMADRIVASNRALQSILGYREHELRGKTFGEITHPDDRGSGAHQYADLVAGRHDQYQTKKRFLRSDGQIVWGNLTVSLVRGSDGVPRFSIAMVEDVTERQRAAAELVEAKRHLAASREAERLRLARDLHDGPVQDLLAISYQLAARRRPDSTSPDVPDPGSNLETTRRNILGVVGGLRQVIGELRPPGLAEFGLPAALEGFVAHLRREGDVRLPTITLEIDPDAVRLPQTLALTLFRIAQESLRNVLRHSEARQATIRLRVFADNVVLEISDDGRGFRVPARMTGLAQAGHYGLAGLSERVEQEDGELTVASSPGEGMTVTARLPVLEAVQA